MTVRNVQDSVTVADVVFRDSDNVPTRYVDQSRDLNWCHIAPCT